MKKKFKLASLVMCMTLIMGTIGVFAGSQSKILGSTMNTNWADITLTVASNGATARMTVYGTNAGNASKSIRVRGYNAFGEMWAQDGITYAHTAPTGNNAFVRGEASFRLNELTDTLAARA